MRWARSWARVRPRMGIMAVLSVQWFGGGVVGVGSPVVGVHKLGNSRALPGGGDMGAPSRGSQDQRSVGQLLFAPSPKGLDQMVSSAVALEI
ncbi:hypothetical protein I547_4100 [Mycobacterium kansasii 824]|nr:hypothetical protein I547_4100 [Mycobacterium kansasii 824]